MGFSLGIGGGKNKSKSSSSTDNTLDQWSQQQYSNLSGQVQGLLGQGFKPYTGDLSAGKNAMQEQAGQAVTGLLGFTPDKVQAQSFKGADLSAYMNPHQQEVIDAALGDIERSRQQQRVSDAQGATAAGAWGGSRHGVADSLTNEAALRQSASTAANLRSEGFNQAASLFQQDANRQLGADQFNTSAGLQGAQLGLSAAGLLGQMGAQDREFDQAGLDRLYQEFLRGQDDPYKRSQVLLGLLGATPMITDSKGTGKSTSTSISAQAGFSKG